MRRSNGRRFHAAPVLLALAVACGGGGGDAPGDGGTGGGPETAALFCDTLYDTFAQRWAECSKAPLAWATQLIARDELCARVDFAMAGGRATYDRADAGACLSFFETASCADLRGIRDEVKYVAACDAAVTGTGAATNPPTSCSTDYECASGRCAGSETSCAGACAPGAGVGQYCGHTRDCAAGLYCHVPPGTCRPWSSIPGDGQACTPGVGCQPGLYCDANVDGFCRPQITAGACPPAGRAMAPGYGCFGGTAQPLLGPGATCSASDDRCGPGLYCNAGNVCTQQPAVGEACAYVGGAYLQECIGGSCGVVSHTCIATVPSPCFTDWECGGGFCISGSCQGGSCF